MGIINWICENKEWLFSGLGIAILSIIVGGIRILFKKRSDRSNKIIIKQYNEAANVTQIGVQHNYTVKDENDV